MVSIVMLLFRIFFFSSWSPVDLPINDRNIDAMSSAGVKLSNSQFSSVWRILVHTSLAVSLGSRIIPKKSARLWNLFLSGIKWSQNNEYSWFIFIFLGSLSLTVFLISVTASSHRALYENVFRFYLQFFYVPFYILFACCHPVEIYFLCRHFDILYESSSPQFVLLNCFLLEYG